MLETTLIDDKLKEQIESAISLNRFPHSVFIRGNEGGGSLPIAIAIANEILKSHQQSAGLFGEIEDNRALKLEHPDLHIVFPIQQLQSKNQVTSSPFINDFRAYYKAHPYTTFQDWLIHIGQEDKNPIISVFEAEAIIKKLSLKSFEGGNQILIIWKPEFMNLDCANKLLKIIEEPEPGNIIIMVGENWESLLPTIRSRTQLINQKPFSDEVLENWLVSSLGISASSARKIASIAKGNPRKALGLINDSDADSELSNKISKWVSSVSKYNRTNLINWVDDVSNLSRNEKKRLLDLMLEKLSRDYKTDKGEFHLTDRAAEKLESLLEDTRFKLLRNAYSKSLFLSMSLEACKIFSTGTA